MKITDAENIVSGEKELIDTITGDLNWEVIETVFQKKYRLGLQDDVEYKQGDIIIHNNKIAYKLDFDIKITLSVIFDRTGECLEVAALSDTKGPLENAVVHNLFEPETESLSESPANGNVSEMASRIAEMISDINQK